MTKFRMAFRLLSASGNDTLSQAVLTWSIRRSFWMPDHSFSTQEALDAEIFLAVQKARVGGVDCDLYLDPLWLLPDCRGFAGYDGNCYRSADQSASRRAD